ncbi:type II toxin-antitoxin system Phd/YefM family antitoxin [Prosthecomicrobium sp. N25]|uniref:type II toxin-antitoxin system Phd/YefM family antitoxin n=1 Tax=Prosthecomicrobium sp. N25 TaxID=3129254 RepID=UPI003077323D
MRSYPIHEARAAFSKLIDLALAGEPQRVTRHGKEAVVIVSEAEWNARPKAAPTLADLMLLTVGAGEGGDLGDRPWNERHRPLGSDFAD